MTQGPAVRRSPGIRVTPSGRWQARYYDPAGKLRGKTFTRKSDAQAFLATMKTDIRRGNWIDPALSATGFGERAELWADHKLNLRRSTRSRDLGCLKNHVLPTFGSYQVGRIDRAAVQAWVKKLSDGGLSAETVRRCYRILRAILAEAVEARCIPDSPCRRISLPRINHREQAFLTAVEVERLVSALPEEFRCLVYCAVYLGCRWGELVGLRRENVDLLRRRVRIVGSLEEVDGKTPVYVQEIKSRASRRMLSIPPFLAEMLAEHLSRSPSKEYVFVGPRGALLRRSNFRSRSWKPALVAAGLDDELRFHDLRHSCAALLIAQGAHPKEIQARLGHASITTTLNTYGHLWPALGEALDERMEETFRTARADVASMWPEGGLRVVPLLGHESETGR